MGLDMWFREDVTRILASTLEVMRNSTRSVTPLDVEAAGAYQRGFVDALLAVAVAFGVRAPSSNRPAPMGSPELEWAPHKETGGGGGNGNGWR